MANARVLVDRWDSIRRTAATEDDADATFREFLMGTVPEELHAAGRPLDENLHAHWYSTACTMSYCVELGRHTDALLLAQWLAGEYVPIGDNHAQAVLRSCSDCCRELSRVPELFEQATELLWRMASHVPRDADLPLARAHCQALLTIALTHRDNNTPDTYYQRVRIASGVYRDVIDRWSDSDDRELRGNVAYAMTQRAIALIELGDEPEARLHCAQLLDSYRDAMLPAELGFATHAADVLDTIDFSEPTFKTAYLDAMDRKNRHDGRHSDEKARVVRIARYRHEVSRLAVRRCACLGVPLVLLLRNFDLTETATVSPGPPNRADEPERYSTVIRARAGSPLVGWLSDNTHLVTVTSTRAGALEADRRSTDLGSVHFRLALTLLDNEWLSDVRGLIAISERIVIWAQGKTPGLVAELGMITSMGREADTAVLLEDQHGPGRALHGEQLVERTALSPKDPLLARFPVVMRAEDALRPEPMDSPFARAVADPVEVVGLLPLSERVARVRTRVDAARRH